MKFAGHVKRNQEDRWERRVMEWTPYGNIRKRGRPKKRWEEEIIQFCGITWGRDTNACGRLEQVGEVYTLRWGELY